MAMPGTLCGQNSRAMPQHWVSLVNTLPFCHLQACRTPEPTYIRYVPTAVLGIDHVLEFAAAL